MFLEDMNVNIFILCPQPPAQSLTYEFSTKFSGRREEELTIHFRFCLISPWEIIPKSHYLGEILV